MPLWILNKLCTFTNKYFHQFWTKFKDFLSNLYLVWTLGKLEEIQELKRRQEAVGSEEYLKLQAEAQAQVLLLWMQLCFQKKCLR